MRLETSCPLSAGSPFLQLRHIASELPGGNPDVEAGGNTTVKDNE